MEIEYIRIKRVNLEIEKAYATGLDAICILLIPPTDYYFSVSPPLECHNSRKPDRQASFTHTTDVYTEHEKRYEWNNKNNLH